MKKLLAVVLGLAVMTFGLFAESLEEIEAGIMTIAEDAGEVAADAIKNVEFPTGTWIDENWNAHWVMDVAKVHLYDAITGKKIFTFTKDNTKDFKFVPSADGVSLSFSCAETHRFYKFTKSFSLDKDLTMFIDPDWTDVDYTVNLKFKSVNMPE